MEILKPVGSQPRAILPGPNVPFIPGITAPLSAAGLGPLDATKPQSIPGVPLTVANHEQRHL
jgi:hypothetical protein